MLPLRDTLRARRVPVVTWGIVILNVLVFFYELSLSPAGLEQMIRKYALLPSALSLQDASTWFPLLSHMFMHGGWVHFLSNMWILVIFGDNVEDRMGSFKYLVFYLVGGIAAALIQFFLTSDPTLPMVGASGAIAAVMGAYLLFFPWARVHTFIPVFIFPWFIQVPAVIFLGLWFVTQLFSGVLTLAPQTASAEGGVAWWAHIGGFAFGLVMAGVFASRKKPRTYADEYYPW
ncbi:MAG TPA: rhomboid family intramembrane serine protease [Anaerolineaceae bacterium]|nr:rhomboid family intramembrane serine protease [Anaerolineaceae bacterium]